MTVPYSYQRSCAKQLHLLGGRGLLAMPLGSGKSFISLLWAMRHPEARPIVVVCPAFIKYQWASEVRKHTGLRAEVLETTWPGKKRGLRKAAPVTIVNYDILGRRRADRANTGPGWLGFLKELNPQLVVIDEAHFCSSRKAARTRWVKELCSGVPHVIALTGTPMVNRPAELWPVLNILRPDLFPAFWPYALTFCGAKRNRWGWDVSGSSNETQLHRLLTQGANGDGRGMMIRYREEDILPFLPPKRRLVVPLDLTDRDQYQKARDTFREWLLEHRPERLDRTLRAERLTQLGYLRRLAAELKLPGVLDWLEVFLQEGDHKLIVFAIHRKVIQSIHGRFPSYSVVVDGSTPDKQRRLHVDQFLRSKGCRLLVGNLDAAGAGWSAPGVSRAAFVELPWSPGKLRQGEGRVRGVGRGEAGVPTTSWILTARDTVEEQLCGLLQRKDRLLAGVLDGAPEQGDLDIFDLLCQTILEEGEEE
jgi:SWI/SNF-related matrix-associated actin-dependent regulator 1 of chromatin subfamily A